MKKPSNLKVFLTTAFVVCLVVSNIISGKQMQLPFGLTMTSAVVVFPITYILSDVFSEVYGYAWSRITCYMGFAANLFAVLVFALVIATPAPAWFENQAAFAAVLGNTPRAFIASMAGLLAGDFVNDRVFRAMKKHHEHEIKGFGARAILSSLAGEAADSALFIPIMFLGEMPFASMVTMGVLQVALKVGYECVILPVTTKVCKAVKKAEG